MHYETVEKLFSVTLNVVKGLIKRPRGNEILQLRFRITLESVSFYSLIISPLLLKNASDIVYPRRIFLQQLRSEFCKKRALLALLHDSIAKNFLPHER